MNVKTQAADRRAEAGEVWSRILEIVGDLPTRSDRHVLVGFEAAILALRIGVQLTTETLRSSIRKRQITAARGDLNPINLAHWGEAVEDFAGRLGAIAIDVGGIAAVEATWSVAAQDELAGLAHQLFDDVFTVHRVALDAIMEPSLLEGEQPVRDLQAMGELACRLIGRANELAQHAAADVATRLDDIRIHAAIDEEGRRFLTERGVSVVALAESTPPFAGQRDALQPRRAGQAVRKAAKAARQLREFFASADRALVFNTTIGMQSPGVFLAELDRWIERAEHSGTVAAIIVAGVAAKPGHPANIAAAVVTSRLADSFTRVTGLPVGRSSEFMGFLQAVFEELSMDADADRAARNYLDSGRADEAFWHYIDQVPTLLRGQN